MVLHEGAFYNSVAGVLGSLAEGAQDVEGGGRGPLGMGLDIGVGWCNCVQLTFKVSMFCCPW